MADLSPANTLHTIAFACATVADHLNDPANEHPHSLKKVTAQGKSCFRFTTVIRIDGEEIEVQVKNFSR